MSRSYRSGKLTIILLSYYSGQRLVTTTEKIMARMKQEAIDLELIIMDDGSTDDSFEIAENLEHTHKEVRAFQLSRNYTTNYSKFAGLEKATGECAVFVPDDLQRSLDTVVKMYRLWQGGEQIIVDYRESRNDGFFNNLFANSYYRLMDSFSEVKFPPGGTDGCMLDREVIDIINKDIHPINTSLMVEVLRLGFTPYFLPTERIKQEQKSRWTLKKKWRLATDTFFNASSFPIKMISRIGISILILSFFLIILLVYAKLYTDGKLFGFTIPGWTTTIVFITIFNALNLLGLAIVAEYIWRIFEEVKGRPGYIIKNKKNKEE